MAHDHDPLVVSAAPSGPLGATLRARTHQWAADEPVGAGGTDLAATPMELLLGALASCTLITLRMYAQRKGWALDGASVRVEGSRDGAGRLAGAAILLSFPDALDQAQRLRLVEIAGKCPIHKVLVGGIPLSLREA